MAVVTLYRASVAVGSLLRGTIFSFDPIQDATYVTQANLASSMTNHALRIEGSTPVHVNIRGDAALEKLPNGMKVLRDPENPELFMDASRIIDCVTQGDRGFSIVPD
jgi:hypothetical protein